MAAPLLFLTGFTTSARCHFPCCLSLKGERGDAAFPASFSSLTSPRKRERGSERECVCEERQTERE